jgi:hypothetical protein
MELNTSHLPLDGSWEPISQFSQASNQLEQLGAGDQWCPKCHHVDTAWLCLGACLFRCLGATNTVALVTWPQKTVTTQDYHGEQPNICQARTIRLWIASS